MPINSDKPHLWKADVTRSINSFNDYFFRYSPVAFRKKCVILTKEVLEAFETYNLEMRQYSMLKRWLIRRGYKQLASDASINLDAMPAGSFSVYHTTPPGKKLTSVNNLLYCIVKLVDACEVSSPIIITAKSSENISSSVRSAKRDARKFAEFKGQHEGNAKFILLLCGYFDGYYLGPQAAEGIDWIWQHRLEDLNALLS